MAVFPCVSLCEILSLAQLLQQLGQQFSRPAVDTTGLPDTPGVQSLSIPVLPLCKLDPIQKVAQETGGPLSVIGVVEMLHLWLLDLLSYFL